jgi:hypothetical protein
LDHIKGFAMELYECIELKAQLKTLTDIELASLIIEFVESDEVAVALGEETMRRLTSLRVKDGPAARANFQPVALS